MVDSNVVVDAVVVVAVFDLLVEAVVLVIVFVAVAVVLVKLLAELVVIAFLGRVVFFVVADMALSTWGIAIVNRPKKG